MWVDVAAHNGDFSAASERDSLGDRLTPEEVQEGDDSALAYLASHEGQAKQVGLEE